MRQDLEMTFPEGGTNPIFAPLLGPILVYAKAGVDGNCLIDANLESLLQCLPECGKQAVRQHISSRTLAAAGDPPKVIELTADCGRKVSMRFSDGTEDYLPISLDMEEALASLMQHTRFSSNHSCEPHMSGSNAGPPSIMAASFSAFGMQIGRSVKGIATFPRVAQSAQQALHIQGAVRQMDPFMADNRVGIPGTLHRISAIRDRDSTIIGLTYRVGRHLDGMPVCLFVILFCTVWPPVSQQGVQAVHVCVRRGG